MATESLGYMLQGVSQQQPKVRLPGQLTEQVNFMSDVTKGLTSRPHTDHIGSIGSPVGNQTRSVTVKIEEELFRIVLRNNALPRVFDYAGIERSVTGSGQAYCSTDSAVYVYDTVAYIANRNTIVREDNSYDPSGDVLTNVAYAYCLGGAFSRKFSISIKWGGNTLTAIYTSPDGTNSGDAEEAAAEYIMQQLYDDFVLKATTDGHTELTFRLYETYLVIQSSGAPIESLDTRDGDGGAFLKGDVDTAPDIAALPKYAPNGTLLKIVGDASSADDFWMRFQTNDVGVPINGGFGREGVWREHFDVEDSFAFNANTMPHVLEKQSNGTFTFGPETWEPRRVGNEESNMHPSFVGAAIKDVREMQGRLTFITSASTIVMSRVDFPGDFFKKSAVANTVTDPIDIRATDEGTIPLEYMVAFDKDLFIFAENAQFVISGSGTLTPDNASTALATKYVMSVSTRPVATGRTVLMPYVGARFSGVNEYFTSDDFATHAVDNLTKTLPKYIDGEIVEIATASNEGLAFFLTTKSISTGEVWVYKYLWEDLQKTQSSWSRWVFPGGVKHVAVDQGVLYIWLSMNNVTTAQESVIQARLDTPDNDRLGYPVCLDSQEVFVPNPSPGDEFVTITSTKRDLSFVLLSDDDDAPVGDVIIPDETVTSGGNVLYRFRRAERPWIDNATIIHGRRYERWAELSRVYARRYDGQPRSDVHVMIHTLYVDFDNSGHFDVWMKSPIRGDAVMGSTDWFPMDDDPINPWEVSVRSGTLQVVWGEFAHLGNIEIRSNDARPTTLLEVRYEPEFFKDGG